VRSAVFPQPEVAETVATTTREIKVDELRVREILLCYDALPHVDEYRPPANAV
jgi:hypothetical protein